MHRRHLSESQRAMVAAKLANMPAHRPAGNKAANLPASVSQADAARMLNVSSRLLRDAKVVRESGIIRNRGYGLVLTERKNLIAR